MADLKTQPAVLQAVIQITRKDTGKVEEYVLTGAVDDAEKLKQAGIEEKEPKCQ